MPSSLAAGDASKLPGEVPAWRARGGRPRVNALVRQRLEQCAASGAPVRVALVGAGRFGTSVAAQVGQVRGLRLVAVADPNATNGAEALRAAGWSDDQMARADSVPEASQRGAAGAAVLAPRAADLAALPIDVVVEATGQPEIGARTALDAIRLGRHVVMVTVEADVTCGWALAREARRQGVVYSLTAGDQPGSIMELYDWALTVGLEVVAAGRGTRRYPADRAGVPDEAFARYGYGDELVQRRRLNPQMYNAFRDGTKAQIEMCAVANLTGLPPDVRGMHEPSTTLPELPRLFALEEDGGLLSKTGVVDLANAVAPDGTTLLANNIEIGVWLVVTSRQPLVREDLGFYGLPTDPSRQRAVLHRPFHLCGLETPWTIAQAVLLGAATGTPLERPTAEVLAVAKRDLGPGDVLDGAGGANVSGLVDSAGVLTRDQLLPLGLAYGVAVDRPVRAGEPIPSAAVRMSPDSLLAQLRGA